MNQAAICKALIQAGGQDSFDALIAATGLGETRLSAHLNKLCGEGVLLRDRAQVKVKNHAKCSSIARTDMKDEPATVEPPPRAPTVGLPPVVARQRPTIPVGLSVFKGVPIPEKRTAARPIALNFTAMEVGDCFLVPVAEGFSAAQMASRVSAEYSAYRARINSAFNATVRMTVYPKDHPQFGEPCIGVWRINAPGPVIAIPPAKPTRKGKKVA